MMGKSGGGRPASAPACRDLQRALPPLPAPLRLLRAACATLPASVTASLTAATDAVVAAARRHSRMHAAPPFLEATRYRRDTARPRRERHCP